MGASGGMILVLERGAALGTGSTVNKTGRADVTEPPIGVAQAPVEQDGNSNPSADSPAEGDGAWRKPPWSKIETRTRQQTLQRKETDMIAAVLTHCAGIDIGKRCISVCLMVGPAEGEPKVEIRDFGTFTADLEAMKQWLVQAGCTHVAMESTGSYWKPVFNPCWQGLPAPTALSAWRSRCLVGPGERPKRSPL